MQARTVEYSKLTLAVLMLPEHANIMGNIHGGEIMKLMDNAAGAVAHRHTRTPVVTVRVDEMEFLHPILIGNLVTCHAKMTFVGRSSMEISVAVTVEDLLKDESAKPALTAYFTFVSMDRQGKPKTAPVLEIVSDEECRLFEEGRQRYLKYKQRENERKEGFQCSENAKG